MKNSIFQEHRGERCARWVKNGLLAAGAASAFLLAAAATAKPVIVHHPVQVAVQGEPLGLRATVRDAGGRVSSVSVFYASSRGTAPFRRDLSTTGSGVWFGTLPGHLIGPRSNLFYYVHAENSAGESTDTEWIPVKVVEPGLPEEDTTGAMPPSSAAAGPREQGGSDEAAPSSMRKYLVPAAIVIGGAAAIGGGIALASSHGGGKGGGNNSGTSSSGSSGGSNGGSSNSSSKGSSKGSSSSGGSSSSSGSSDSGSGDSGSETQGDGGDAGGGDGTTVSNGNYGGNYDVCFEPSGADGNAVKKCESGMVNVYVENGAVQVAGLWGGEVLTGTMAGSSFTAAGNVDGRQDFPPAHLVVSGNAGSSSCSAHVSGESTDSSRPGSFSGNLAGTAR